MRVAAPIAVRVAMIIAVATVGTSAVSVAAQDAAAAITAADVTRSLDALTADSFCPRPTPSAALERAAEYVASEFQRFGLTPGMSREVQGTPSWIQRYPLPGQQWVNLATANLGLVVRYRRQGRNLIDDAGDPLTRIVAIPFANAAYFTPEVGRQTVAKIHYNPFAGEDIFLVGKPLTLVAGRQTLATVRRAADGLAERTVLYVPGEGVDSATRHQIIATLYAASEGVIVAGTEDSVRFAAERTARQAPVALVERFMEGATDRHEWPWAVTASGAAIRAVLAAADEDLTRLAADSQPILRPLASTIALLDVDAAAPPADVATAPNVVGLLQGSDPKLKDEYLVLSAHLDTRAPDSADAIRDDNTAGIAALLAVARAFSQRGARPRRSVVFLATSGGAPAFGGANYFAHQPPLPGTGRQPLAANLTLDLGGAMGDSLVVDGLDDVTLAPAPAPVWVAAAHPELGLRVVAGGTVVAPRSDHFAFARVTVPSLYLHAGEARPGPTAAPDVVRVARFVWYLGAAIANVDRRPQWTAAGREQLRAVILP